VPGHVAVVRVVIETVFLLIWNSWRDKNCHEQCGDHDDDGTPHLLFHANNHFSPVGRILYSTKEWLSMDDKKYRANLWYFYSTKQ
jgi:hypothetical protein